MSLFWLIIFLQCHGIINTAILAWRDHPQDRVVFEGHTVMFRCQMLNNGLRSGEHQHWVRLSNGNTKQTFISDNNLLSAYIDYNVRNRFALTNNANRGYYQLTIKQVTAFDMGEYGCMIYGRSSDRRAMSHFGKLTVVPRYLRAPPVCSLVPKHPKPGGLAEFTCTSMSGTTSQATNLTWSDGSTTWIPTQVSLSTTTLSVSFHKVLGPRDNHATYTCSERWPVPGSEIRTCSIVPFDIPINVTVEPRMQKVPIGEYAIYHCEASAVPPPSQYLWYFEGYPVTERPRQFQIRDGGKTLYIDRVQGGLGQQYEIRCKAGNGIDGLRTAVAYLYLLPEGAERPEPNAPRSAGNGNNTGESISGGNRGSKNHVVSHSSSPVTILLGITCAIGCIILILLSLLLFVCLKGNSSKRNIPPEPITKTELLPCKEISKPIRTSSLHEDSLQEIKSRTPRRTSKGTFSGSARGVRRTVRHSYQPLRKGYVRRKGSTVSLGNAGESLVSNSSVYENAAPMRLSYPDEADASSLSTNSYANSTCDSGYANSATSPPPRKSSRQFSSPQLDPISL
ncbi:uncharacterized protein [Amphiura filiformis]|uniref:uncharacterized protein n=1 Tax=Amphiura filiformis TaxID=82378 RepID=UPI003B211000